MVLNEIELWGIGGQRKATECQGLLGTGEKTMKVAGVES